MFQWGPITGWPRFVLNGYIRGFDTPLFERTFEALGLMMARAKYWEEEFGVATRGIFSVWTDGLDNVACCGGKIQATDLREVVEKMIAAEKYVLRFYGVVNDEVDDYTDIGVSMGFPKEWVTSIPNDGKALRAELELFSQTSKDFSQAADPADFTDVDDDEDDLNDVDFDD